MKTPRPPGGPGPGLPAPSRGHGRGHGSLAGPLPASGSGDAGSAASRRSVTRGHVVALPLAALVAVVVLVINEAAWQRSITSLAQLERRAVASTQAQTVLRRMLDAETGQRGYLLTSRPVYLDPWREAEADVRAGLDALQRHYAEQPQSQAQQQVLEALRRQALARLARLQETVTAHDVGDAARQVTLLDSPTGRQQMQAVREAAEQLTEHERNAARMERAAIMRTLGDSRLGVNLTVLAGFVALLLLLRQSRLLDAVQRRHAQALQAEHRRLEAEVERRTADLTELARHLHHVREDESARLARELHDELGALLTAAKLDLARLRRSLVEAGGSPDALTRLQHLNKGIDNGIALKRRIIEDLRPSSLSNLGLVTALEILTREFAGRTGLTLHTALEPLVLTEPAQITAYRLVQEALTNVSRHAGATRVEVRLAPAPAAEPNAAAGAGGPGFGRLSVSDDGVGFDPGEHRPSAHGLMGMRYRVEAAGGLLTLRTAPGHGTLLQADLPLASPAPRALDDDAADSGRTGGAPQPQQDPAAPGRLSPPSTSAPASAG